MSWLNPGDYAQDLLNSERPDVLELAKYTSLCPRIEPLLLRNMRLKFLSGSEPELEYQLWFSRIVAARSTRNIVLDQAAARLLADELKENQDLFLEVWHDTQGYTVHWSALDKLEQQLRYESLLNNQPAINNGLQKILRHISRTQDEEARLNFARWAKRTLPAISSETASNETALLAQYAATALGATAAWTKLSSIEPLPAWLANALPGPSSTFAHSKIGLQLRYDTETNHQVLECLPPEESKNVLDLPTPLPARLYIQCENETTGRWLVIDTASRIKLPQVSQSIELHTIDGKAYQLLAKFESGPSPEPTPKHLNLYLTHVREDAGIASKIAKDLERQLISVTLIEEKPGEPALETVHDLNARLLRLWTPKAQSQWATVKLEPSLASGNSLLLRMGQVELPLGTQPAQVINLDETQNLMPAIQRWLEDSNKPVPFTREEQIDSLLKELENPETRPRRRLEIGDLLAEMGDSRKGVGVKAYEVIEYPPEIQRLLDELNDIKTEPPRRLEIGNQLAELGDPRPGVGLDDKGLPDIDWVEIPAGPFISGGDKNRRTIDLPRYYISRYPVTNSQYEAFISAGGYSDERWWRDLKKPEPQKPGWKQPNRPRERVDWYEALAFTRWLSAKRGVEIILPTEQQWEKAARGTDGRQYPWGDKYRSGYANINETLQKTGPYYLQSTSAVGLYPQGESPYHVDDMAGNVWEWCLNKVDQPEYTAADQSNDSRVLRGGSWHYDPDGARASVRDGNLPDNRNGSFGFRVVCSSPYTDH